MSPQTPSAAIYVGVDIAKVSLALQLPDQAWSLNNDAEGHAALLARLGALAGPAHVVCEATGGYERELVFALHQAGVAVTVLNPRHVRDFARARGLLAKTDGIDVGRRAAPRGHRTVLPGRVSQSNEDT
jgi:transposase